MCRQLLLFMLEQYQQEKQLRHTEFLERLYRVVSGKYDADVRAGRKSMLPKEIEQKLCDFAANHAAMRFGFDKTSSLGMPVILEKSRANYLKKVFRRKNGDSDNDVLPYPLIMTTARNRQTQKSEDHDKFFILTSKEVLEQKKQEKELHVLEQNSKKTGANKRSKNNQTEARQSSSILAADQVTTQAIITFPTIEVPTLSAMSTTAVASAINYFCMYCAEKYIESITED